MVFMEVVSLLDQGQDNWRVCVCVFFLFLIDVLVMNMADGIIALLT